MMLLNFFAGYSDICLDDISIPTLLDGGLHLANNMVGSIDRRTFPNKHGGRIVHAFAEVTKKVDVDISKAFPE